MTGSDNAAAWIDKLAIQEVIDRYCDALNRKDWEAYEALFTADAVWELSSPWGFKLEGARAIRDGISKLVAKADFIVQTNHCTVETFLGADSASATTTIRETSRGKDARSATHLGMYCDELVRVGGSLEVRAPSLPVRLLRREPSFRASRHGPSRPASRYRGTGSRLNAARNLAHFVRGEPLGNVVVAPR